MTRYLVLWRQNSVAPWPTDPDEGLKMSEMLTGAVADLLKKGLIKEFGYFLDGISGYAIGEGDATDIFQSTNMFSPYIIGEIHEIIPFEKGAEILKAVNQAKLEAVKK